MIMKNNKEVGFRYKNILPDGYQRIEYIESTGTNMGRQYINTGFVPNPAGYKVNVVFSQTLANNNTGCFVYGAYDSTNGYKPSLYVYSSTRKLGVYYNNSSNLNTNIDCDTDKDYDVTITTSGANVTYNINGTTGTVTSSYNQLDNDTPVVICTSYVGNTYLLKCRIKRFKIYDENDTLARDMYPCIRKSDNKTGMYDLMTKAFYANLGNVEFDTGNNLDTIDKVYHGTDLVFEQGFTREQEGVPPITTTKQTIGKDLKDYRIYGKTETGTLPSYYQQVEYIQSSATQYINTGLEGKNGYTFETKVIFTDFTNSYSYLAGFGTSSSNRIYFTRGQKSGLTDGWTFDGDSHNLTGVSVATNTEYTYKSIMETSNQQLYRNGTLLASNTRTEQNSYGNVWLFGTDYNHGLNGGCACKMYYAKFTYDGVLVRDYVPCYRKSDGEIGMYDRVEGKFYANMGSGSFSKGNDVNETPLIDKEVNIYGVGEKTKNMINVPKDYTFTSYPNLTSLIDMDKIELGVQYKVVWSGSTKGSTYDPAMNLGGNVGWLQTMGPNGGSKTFTYTTLPSAIYIYSNGSNASRSSGVTSSVQGLMFMRADETTDYEPYGYKIPITASDGINEIKTNVYLDKPLYKTGSKIDYVDYKNKKVNRNIQEQIITGQEAWEGGTDFFRFKISNSNIVDGDVAVTDQYCNYAEAKIVTVAGSEIGASVYYSSGLGGTYFRIRPSSSIGSIQNFKTLMQQYYANGHPLKVYFPLNTTTSQTIDLPDIPSLKNTTTTYKVTSGVNPSNMYIKYKGK